MIFIICIGIGIVGIIGMIWISSANIRYLEYRIEPGSEWFQFHPEHFQSGIGSYFQKHIRAILKKVLIWMIAIYRKLSQRVQVKQVVKKKVREFLYEHSRDVHHTPSDFWHKVNRRDHLQKNHQSDTLPE